MNKTRLLPNVTLFALAFFAVSPWTRDVMAARFVPATISVDGKTLLEGTTSDDGSVDADGVWDYLKKVKFKAKQSIADPNTPNANTVELVSKAKRGMRATIVVEIAYGGMAFTRKLKLIRVPKDRQGREWALDPVEVDRMFDERFIRRSHAARLDKPRRTKR